MKAIVLLLAALLLVTPGRAADPIQPAEPAAPQIPNDPPAPARLEPVRFESVDVFVDSGDKPLAAYQFEVKAKAGDVLLAGLEGGEHAAFKPAPYYDPHALLDSKVIVAAFSTRADLPHGRTRVARLMVQVSGPVEPAYDATLTTAASSDGKPIPAGVTVLTVRAAAASPAGLNPPDPSATFNSSDTSNPPEGAVP